MSDLRIENVSSLQEEEVQVKMEPEDTGYEDAYQQITQEPSEYSPVTDTDNASSQNVRSILNNMLDGNKELTVKSVIDDLLQRNHFLLGQVDASIYKPQSRNPSSKKYDDILKTKYADHPAVKLQFHVEQGHKIVQSQEKGHILRPGSPTTSCTIPKKDVKAMTRQWMEMNFMYSNLVDSKHQHAEFVCGIASKAYIMTDKGVNIKSDVQFYWCNFCSFKTESNELLVQHVMEHRFHCKYCSYQTFSRADVIRHSYEEHEEFKDAAKTLKFCAFNADYKEAEKFRKRKLEEDLAKQRPTKKFKSAAQKEKEKAEKLKKKEEEKLKKKREEEFDAFDMEVDEVDENGQEEEEGSGDKILIPRTTSGSKPVAQPVAQPGGQNLSTVTYTPSVTKLAEQQNQEKQSLGNVTSTSTTKSGNTVTVSSGLCWNCGYCSFVTLSQTFLKTHLSTKHMGKAHKYVAMLVSSQEEMNRIKEKDAMVYASPSLLTSAPAKPVSDPTETPTPPPAETQIQVPLDSTPKTSSQTEDSDDEEYIPEEEKKKYPLTYKCAHCNFNAPVCFKIKEHLQMKHLGCVLYALDMRAIKLKQRRYVFFCHRKNCSFTTKKTQEYLSHSESCTPWLEEYCPENVDQQTKKCLEMTRSFSTKISMKAFQMAKNFKSNNRAEYACLYCAYSTNNNTRLKKHLLSNHRNHPTVMRDMVAHTLGKKPMVYFCRHCLWESREGTELVEHLISKHDDHTNIKDDFAAQGIKLEQPDTVNDSPVTKLNKEQKGQSSGRSGQGRSSSPIVEQEEHEEEEDEIQPEDLEVSEEEVQRMMDEYVKDEASHGRSPGRPMRKASAEASVRVRAQGHQPPMFRCMHCYHMCFGVNLMRNHIKKHHPKEPLRAIDVKKMMARQFAYFCYCPQDRCKTVNTSEQVVIDHAMLEHGLEDSDEHLKALLLPFTPQTSSVQTPPSVRKETTKAKEDSYAQFDKSTRAYECFYCTSRNIEDSVEGIKAHIKENHAGLDIVFRDCLARKLKKSSRIFMCGEEGCNTTYPDQKEHELHKLAHENAKIYECTKCQWFTATPTSIVSHMTEMHKGDAETIEIELHLDDDGQVVKRVTGTKIKQEPPE